MPNTISKTRARTFQAALIAMRDSVTTLIELLDGELSEDSSFDIETLIEKLGGGSEDLIMILDDAMDIVAQERNIYVDHHSLDLGDMKLSI